MFTTRHNARAFHTFRALCFPINGPRDLSEQMPATEPEKPPRGRWAVFP